MPELPRERRRRGPERRADLRRAGARFKAAVLVAVVAIAVLALEIAVNRGPPGGEYTVLAAPPEELVGTWDTENPRYADRAFVIGHDHIELHLGEEGGIRSHQILSIRGVEGSDSWAYEIDYLTPEGERTLGVHLHPDGVLRLRNPPDMVWRRKPAR